MASSVNLDTSEVLNITCKKGDTFSITFTLKDSVGVGLTLLTDEYIFLMQVKSNSTVSRGRSVSSLILSAPNSIIKPIDTSKDMVGDNSTFESPILDDLGNVTIEASAETMSEVPSGVYAYDIQYILPSSTGLDTHKTVLRGRFSVNADITEVFSKK